MKGTDLVGGAVVGEISARGDEAQARIRVDALEDLLDRVDGPLHVAQHGEAPRLGGVPVGRRQTQDRTAAGGEAKVEAALGGVVGLEGLGGDGVALDHC